MRLDRPTAGILAELISAAIHREYPGKIAHVLLSDLDVRPPRELTPIFFGSFDWHSAVHGHWALVRLLRLAPDEPWAPRVSAALSRSFTAERAAGEVAYLEPRPGFETPYGLAWLLQLDAELAEAGERAPMAGWRRALAPLVRLAADRLGAWLARLGHPIRGGEHSQSAFAMGLALDAARATGDGALEEIVVRQAHAFHGRDRAAPVDYEPSAYDFLSPALAVADLMRRVLAPADLPGWLDAFLPRFDRFEPVTPVDRSDGKLAHFDGLDWSRAWMMRGIASALPAAHRSRAELEARAGAHERAGMLGVSGEHYAGAHWLGSFALYALSDRGLSGGGAAAILPP